MIVYTSADSFLQIPKGLGNFSTASGSADVEPLSGSVIELSATTVTLSGAVETLNEYVDSMGDSVADLLLDVTALEDKTSGNTADIASLSGQVDTLSSSTVTGLETAQNAANSANTLASSAYTLADSAYTRADAAYNLAESLTGETGGPSVYVLNLMTQQERAGLYAELTPYRWQEKYIAVSSGFPVQDYAFYFYAGEEASDRWNDGYRGFVPLQLTAIHPDDYGGALFFTGIVKSRQNNSEILWVRYIITSTGEAEKSVQWNEFPIQPGETIINITSGGTLDGDLDIFYNELLNNTNNGGAVLAPFPIRFREEIPDSGETFYAGTVEAFTMGHSTQSDSDNWAIFTARLEWNGRTRVGKWKIWRNEQWQTQTLYWGWLMNGLVCVYDDEYGNWTQAKKEEWYDRILEECWNYDNTSFGIIKVSDKVSSADTGYDQMRVAYNIYRLDSIEAGYNSLHFSGSEKSGDGPSERIYNARIQRGGNIEYWEKYTDFSWLYNKQPSGDGARTFSFTTGGTTYGYFDTYGFGRAFNGTGNNWEFYGPASYGAIRIFDGNGDEPISIGNVIAARSLTASDYADMEWGVRVAFDFFDGADLKRVIGDSVFGGASAGWNLKSLTTIATV